MPKNKTQRPTLKQSVSGGRYMELAISRSGLLLRQRSEARYGKGLWECRKLAMGVLSEVTGHLSELEREKEMERNESYYLCCMVAFIHGAQWTERLISDCQYIKAAAALKQDYELLTRIHEVEADCALEGKTPNVKRAPAGSQFYYGELNKIAHPSNLDRMLGLLAGRSKYVSALPIFHKKISVGFYRLHVWLCCQMAYKANELLANTLSEEDQRVSDCISLFANLCDRAKASNL